MFHLRSAHSWQLSSRDHDRSVMLQSAHSSASLSSEKEPRSLSVLWAERRACSLRHESAAPASCLAASLRPHCKNKSAEGKTTSKNKSYKMMKIFAGINMKRGRSIFVKSALTEQLRVASCIDTNFAIQAVCQ